MADLYETLGVTRDATPEEIKAAFRAKAKATHPDAGGADAAFAEVSTAYSILSVEEKRREYDKSGRADNRAENEHRFAFALIEGMMRKVIEEYEEADDDLICNDIIETMIVVMHDHIAQIETDMEKFKRNVVRLSALSKRFSTKAEGATNVCGNMVDYKIANLNRRLEEGAKAIERHQQAIELLKNQAFKADPTPPPAPMAQTAAGRGGLWR